jgi:hypothetical protein
MVYQYIFTRISRILAIFLQENPLYFLIQLMCIKEERTETFMHNEKKSWKEFTCQRTIRETGCHRNSYDTDASICEISSPILKSLAGTRLYHK